MATDQIIKGSMSRITDGEVVAIFYFQFNPTTDSESHSNDWTFDMPPGGVLPRAQFAAFGAKTINFQLMLDATDGSYDPDKEGVGAQKAWLELLFQPEVTKFMDSLGQYVGPPEILLRMGLDEVWCVGTSLNFSNERRNRQMIVTRCTADISLQIIYTGDADIRGRLQALDALRSLVEVKQGA